MTREAVVERQDSISRAERNAGPAHRPSSEPGRSGPVPRPATTSLDADLVRNGLRRGAGIGRRGETVGELQRTVGNRRLARLLKPRPPIGSGSGTHEREADRLAETVVPSLGSRGDVRELVEEHTGADLGDVRFHSGAQAADAARAKGARAFALGRDVVFGAGQYRPGDRDGQRLIVHELAHVVQQAGGAPGLSRTGRVLQLQPDPAAGGSSAPPAGIDPWPALDLLDVWRGKASSLIDATSTWQMGNWVDYLSRTSLSPGLSLADSQLADIASNAVGNALTALGEAFLDGMKQAAAPSKSAALVGASIGTAIEPGGGTAVGFVIGFLIGVLIEAAASWAFESFTGKSDADEAAAEASMITGGRIENQLTALTAHAQASKTEMEAYIASTKNAIRRATTQSEVEDTMATLELEIEHTPAPRAIADRSLANDLLRIWVREHTATPGHELSGTSHAQWAGVAEHVGLGGREPLENDPTLFAFQTAAEWGKAGVRPEQSEQLIAEAAELAAAPAAGKSPAVRVKEHFHLKEYELEVGDEERAERYLNDHVHWHFEFAAGHKVVYLRCMLDVQTWSGSAYIDEWNWTVYLEFPPDTPGHGRMVPPGPHRHYETFDVWLTWMPSVIEFPTPSSKWRL